MPIITEQVDVFVRIGVVYAFMFLFLILNIISTSVPLETKIEIPLVIMMIYYWSIYRPTLLPPLLIFVSGICFDLLCGWPLGVNTFVFLLVRQIISDQRIFLTSQPFIVVWIGFMVVCVAALFMQWAFFGLIHGQMANTTTILTLGVVSIAAFPVMAILLHFTHKFLPALPEQYRSVSMQKGRIDVS